MAELNYAMFATREGSEIKNTRVDKVGRGGSTRFIFVVNFMDGSWYEEDCTERSSFLAYQHIWANEEWCKQIIQKAILAHYGAAEINTYIKLSKQEQSPHKANVAHAIEIAIKSNELRWDYLPLGIEQADYIISQFAEILHVNLENYDKEGYHRILNLYFVLYTKIKLFNKADEIVIQELLRSSRSDIPRIFDVEKANQIVEAAKSQIETPFVPEEMIVEQKKDDARQTDNNPIENGCAPHNTISSEDVGFKSNAERRLINDENSEVSIEEPESIVSVAVKEENNVAITKQEKQKKMDKREIEVIFCRKCGKKLPADSEFCTYCGTAVITII